MPITRRITRPIVRRLVRGIVGAAGGVPGGGGIPFELKVWGTALDPAWDAAAFTARSLPQGGDSPHDIDGVVSIDTKYASAYMTTLGQSPYNGVQNNTTYPIPLTHSEADRTFTIGPWLKGMPAGPWFHVLDAERGSCNFTVVEKTVPIKYGAAQATDFDGVNESDLHALRVPFDIATVPTAPISMSVFCNARFDALGTEETLFSLYDPANPLNFVVVRKAGNNTLQAALYRNVAGVATLVGSGTNAIFDFDTVGQNPIGTDGWIALELVRSAGALTITLRIFWNGSDVASDGTYQLANTGISGAGMTTFSHMKRGARPAGANFLNGRHNRTVLVHDTATAGQWDTIMANSVDPATVFQRGKRDIDLCGRTPFGNRNRFSGKPPDAVTGTPALIASAVDVPFDAKWTGMPVKFSALTTAQVFHLPREHEGLWELTVFDSADPVVLGPWADVTGYVVGDAVSSGGSTYLCLVGHTSGATTEPGVGVDWETVWDLFVLADDRDITVAWGSTDADALSGLSDGRAQAVNGPRNPFCGGGARFAIKATGDIPSVWAWPLLGDAGP